VNSNVAGIGMGPFGHEEKKMDDLNIGGLATFFFQLWNYLN
jgi:hypothetical protein